MFEETIASRVRPLARAFQATGLARLSVVDEEFELEFRRSPQAAGDTGAGLAPAHSPAATESRAPKPEMVAADVVGIVRLLRPQISEGQQVEGGRDLAFVEALGIRNPVRSRGAGRVCAVFVTDGQPVEYGQPLFALERS